MTDQHALLVHLRPLLQGSARRLLSADEARHAADLAQEGWIAVWRALPELPATCREFDDQVAWCMAVARNRMRNVIRDQLAAPTHGERQSMLPATATLVELLEQVAAAETVQTSYHHGEVLRAINALPAGYRAYVIERFWHGVPTTELQKTMSPSIWGRVKKRLVVDLAHLVSA